MRRAPIFALAAVAAGMSALAGAAAAVENDEGRFGTSVRQDLAARDKAEAARQRQLDLREQAAAAAAQRLQASGATNLPLTTAAPPEAPPEQSEDERLNDLAKIYQAMKPKAAAPIFEQLSLEVQVKVANRMRERATAQIMAAMSPKAAATLTMAIAKRQTSYTVLNSTGSSPQAPTARR